MRRAGEQADGMAADDRETDRVGRIGNEPVHKVTVRNSCTRSGYGSRRIILDAFRGNDLIYQEKSIMLIRPLPIKGADRTDRAARADQRAGKARLEVDGSGRMNHAGSTGRADQSDRLWGRIGGADRTAKSSPRQRPMRTGQAG